MTSQEMEYEWKIVYESMASMAAPGYTSKEISILLTQSQEEIAIETAQKALDSNDYARTVLKNLLTPYASPTLGVYNMLPNGVQVVLPNDFFYPFIEFAITAGTTTQRACKPIDYNSYYTNINNPFAKPYTDLYWRLFDSTALIIISDGTTVTDLKGLYIAKPSPIITANISPSTIDGLSAITQPVLDPIVHRDIVYRAAKKAFAAQKDQTGYQIQNLEENQS